MTSGQLTYDLRRLRIHGLIRRIPHSFRYQVTPAGIRQALFLTRLTQRLLIPGLWITPSLVETRFSPDALVWVTVVFHGSVA
jgi:hypothetical protein